MRGGELLELRMSVRRDVGGIVVGRDGELTGMLANLTAEARSLSLGPLQRPLWVHVVGDGSNDTGFPG